MRIGIGLPAAIPGIAGPEIGAWAEAAEACGFDSVGVIDRLVYDNLDPLLALAAAAARTDRVELLTTVLNVLDRLAATGCDDVVLLPCSSDVTQVVRVADALAEARSVVA